LKNVNGYQGFHYNYYKKGKSISFELNGTFDGDYSIYAFAFDLNPKKNAMVSAIVKVDISINVSTVTTKGYLNTISSMD